MIQLLLLFFLFAIARGASVATDDLKTLGPVIIGGRLATLGEIPYQVSLQKSDTRFHFCGGSIINERYVLTAAHCVVSVDIADISVNVGLIDIRKPHAVHLVQTFYIHEGYAPRNTLINDIALLRVKTPFVFSNLISPVTLPKQNQIVPAGSGAVVSGFGLLRSADHGLKRTNWLYITNDIIISNQAYCRDTYANYSATIKVHDTQICANNPIIEKGSCNGDSGGPLTVNGELVGIVSWGADCADQQYPTVFTRVPSYINWIDDHTL